MDHFYHQKQRQLIPLAAAPVFNDKNATNKKRSIFDFFSTSCGFGGCRTDAVPAAASAASLGRWAGAAPGGGLSFVTNHSAAGGASGSSSSSAAAGARGGGSDRPDQWELDQAEAYNDKLKTELSRAKAAYAQLQAQLEAAKRMGSVSSAGSEAGSELGSPR